MASKPNQGLERTPRNLHEAAKLGDFGKTQQFLEEYLASLHAGATVTDDIINKDAGSVQSPLHVAIRAGKAAIVHLLLSNGVFMDSTDNSGNTALHVAVEYNRYNIVEQLLLDRVHVDINKQNHHGDTPLHIAMKDERLAVAVLLIKSGADYSIQDSFDKTPLHLALQKGNLDLYGKTALQIVKEIQKERSKSFVVNLTDTFGNTPLLLFFSGSSYRSPWAAQLLEGLLDTGASMVAQNHFGESVLFKCIEAQYSPETVHCLITLVQHGILVDRTCFEVCLRLLSRCYGLTMDYTSALIKVLLQAGSFSYRSQVMGPINIVHCSKCHFPRCLLEHGYGLCELLQGLKTDYALPSLKHFCRGSIRGAAFRSSKGKSIKSAIPNLNLPNQLQRYIALVELDGIFDT